MKQLIARKVSTVVLGKPPEKLRPGEWRLRISACIAGIIVAFIASNWLAAH